ncbi:hypothetical protein NCAS_0G00850 [Naumovozyma castellii]|uniref:UspA domain-containing protein n=1 Tax=Naumovozyma castellii TaxID=27288 RepID=G0VHT8_NAUCA|nr:hypothetical protein NCAS_0G00850 [Naumovozyma castellii CBS 4309]CCC70972.1 hypothetical protein NCAS_0G00850 [Naumovozyma castellii CBS 4309]
MAKDQQEEALRSIYRHIYLPNSKDPVGKPVHLWEPCVSFNTVPSSSSEKEYPDLDFEGVTMPSMKRQPFYYHEYPSNSQLCSSKNPKRQKSMNEMFKMAQGGKIVRVDYPSRPMVDNEAMIMTKKQPLWRKKWRERKKIIEARRKCDGDSVFKYRFILFPHEEKQKEGKGSGGTLKKRYMGLSNNSSHSSSKTDVKLKEQKRQKEVINLKIGDTNLPRTIVCHISGRRHTWVALDWLFKELVQDTDHVVILANLPRMVCRSKVAPDTKKIIQDEPKLLEEEWTSGYSENLVASRIARILEYISLILPVDKSIKITVEIAIGKTKKVLIDAINIYTPNLFVFGTLKWSKTENLISYKSNILMDTFCVHYPIPTFIVPARRMSKFELSLQEQFANCEQQKSFKKNNHVDKVNKNQQSIMLAVQSQDSLTAGYESSTETDSLDSVEKTSDDKDDNESVDTLRSYSNQTGTRANLCNIARDYRHSMLKELNTLEANKKKLTNQERQLGKLDIIIKASIRLVLKTDEIDEQSIATNNKDYMNLKTTITGGKSRSQSRPRSMLDVNGYDPRAETKQSELGATLYQSRGSSQIRFAGNVNPKDGKSALGTIKKPQSGGASIPSSKYISDYSYNDVIPLRKIKSTGGLHPRKSSESTRSTASSKSVGEKTKPKSGGFLSLFKGSNNSSKSDRSSRRGSTSSSNGDKDSKGSSRRVSRLFGIGKG